MRYPVSKTGGPRGLGGSTPSPSVGGMAEPGKAARCYRAGGSPPLAGSNPAASVSSPRSSADRAVGFGPTCRPFESGRGVSRCDVVQSAGRPTVNRGTLVRPQPSQLSRPGRPVVRTPVSHIGDAGSIPARGPHSRSRTRLATRPGCLPGEAGSIPVESAPSRRRSVDEHHAPTVAHGGSTPPGETASQG